MQEVCCLVFNLRDSYLVRILQPRVLLVFASNPEIQHEGRNMCPGMPFRLLQQESSLHIEGSGQLRLLCPELPDLFWAELRPVFELLWVLQDGT